MKSKNNYRSIRVANLIKLALIDIFKSGKKLDIKLVDLNITITNLKLSSDFKIAYCYLLPFIANNILSKSDFMQAIDDSKVQIRFMLAKKVKLKYLPEIKFFYDHSFEEAEHVCKVIDSLKNS